MICQSSASAYGLCKALYSRWKRWSDNGVFARIMVGLAAGERRSEGNHDRCNLSEGAPHGLQPACQNVWPAPSASGSF